MLTKNLKCSNLSGNMKNQRTQFICHIFWKNNDMQSTPIVSFSALRKKFKTPNFHLLFKFLLERISIRCIIQFTSVILCLYKF